MAITIAASRLLKSATAISRQGSDWFHKRLQTSDLHVMSGRLGKLELPVIVKFYETLVYLA